jgi:hypothetical protein
MSEHPGSRPVPIAVALERVGAKAEEEDFAGAFPVLDRSSESRQRSEKELWS